IKSDPLRYIIEKKEQGNKSLEQILSRKIEPSEEESRQKKINYLTERINEYEIAIKELLKKASMDKPAENIPPRTEPEAEKPQKGEEKADLPPKPIEEPPVELPTLPPPVPNTEVPPAPEEIQVLEELKKFKYIARDEAGEEFGGTFEAVNEDDARQKLEKMGLSASFIQELGEINGETGERREERHETEEIEDLPETEREPGFLKRNWMKIGLALGLIGSGYGAKKAIDYRNQTKEHYPALKLAEKKKAVKKETAKEVYTVPASISLTNLAKEAKEPPAVTNKTEVATEKLSKPSASTAEEMTAKVKAKLEEKYNKQEVETAKI